MKIDPTLSLHLLPSTENAATVAHTVVSASQGFWVLLAASMPLFAWVLVGYGGMRITRASASWAAFVNQFVFRVALPAMLFHLMSGLSRLPPVDWRLLGAFFGSCFIVFALGRTVGARVFRMDGRAQSVFALGGVFSNNVLLGLPLAHATLGESAIPAVALVVVFNALTLWTLLTASVEWSLNGSFSIRGFATTARSVLSNPLIIAILGGAGFSLTGWTLPEGVDWALGWMSKVATPTSLLALGMGLAGYGLRSGWAVAGAITALKLVAQPLVVWLLAQALGLPKMETQVVVLLGSLAVGANVYLMSRQFQALESEVANSLLLSTALSAVTTPLALAWVSGG